MVRQIGNLNSLETDSLATSTGTLNARAHWPLSGTVFIVRAHHNCVRKLLQERHVTSVARKWVKRKS